MVENAERTDDVALHRWAGSGMSRNDGSGIVEHDAVEVRRDEEESDPSVVVVVVRVGDSVLLRRKDDDASSDLPVVAWVERLWEETEREQQTESKRMRVRARRYFRRSDLEGMPGTFTGLNRQALLDSLTTDNHLVLGEDVEDFSVATILDACRVVRRLADDVDADEADSSVLVCRHVLRRARTEEQDDAVVVELLDDGEEEKQDATTRDDESQDKKRRLGDLETNSDDAEAPNTPDAKKVKPNLPTAIATNLKTDLETELDPQDKKNSVPGTTDATTTATTDAAKEEEEEESSDVVVVDDEDEDERRNEAENPSADVNMDNTVATNTSSSDGNGEENEDASSSASKDAGKNGSSSAATATTATMRPVAAKEGAIHVGPRHQVVVPPLRPSSSYEASSAAPTLVWSAERAAAASSAPDDAYDGYATAAADALRRHMRNQGVRADAPSSSSSSVAESAAATRRSARRGAAKRAAPAPPPVAPRERALTRECDEDSLTRALHDSGYDVAAALSAVRADPSAHLTAWDDDEKESFDEGFRRWRGSLRAVGKGVPTRSYKDVVDYHYRFKIPRQFRKYQERKRDQSRRMTDAADHKSARANRVHDAAAPDAFAADTSGRALRRVAGFGASERRRASAKDFLVRVRDVVGSETYLVLSDRLKAYQRKDVDVAVLKEEVTDLLRSDASLRERFLEFLPKKYRA